MGIFANKPRFTVIDKNPSPTKTVSNFGFLDYLEMTTITGASVPVGYLAERDSKHPLPGLSCHFRRLSIQFIWQIINATPLQADWKVEGGRCGLRGSCMYTAGLIGLLGGFMFAYESSAGRLMGLFPNQEEVEKYKK